MNAATQPTTTGAPRPRPRGCGHRHDRPTAAGQVRTVLGRYRLHAREHGVDATLGVKQTELGYRSSDSEDPESVPNHQRPRQSIMSHSRPPPPVEQNHPPHGLLGPAGLGEIDRYFSQAARDQRHREPGQDAHDEGVWRQPEPSP